MKSAASASRPVRRSLVILAAAACACYLPTGLVARPAPAAFETASVKISTFQGREVIRVSNGPGGQFTATAITLRNIVAVAYPDVSVSPQGGPSWIDSVRFDIVATFPPVTGGARSADTRQPAAVTLMLRRLLADRFKLVVHVEQQNGPAEALSMISAGELGPAIHPASEECGSAMPPDGASACEWLASQGYFASKATTLSRLASWLAFIVRRPVVDRTGLDGLYAIHLEWSGDPMGPPPHVQSRLADPDSRPSGQYPVAFPRFPFSAVPTMPLQPTRTLALKSNLGLKLEAAEGPFSVLVIDSAERPAKE